MYSLDAVHAGMEFGEVWGNNKNKFCMVDSPTSNTSVTENTSVIEGPQKVL